VIHRQDVHPTVEWTLPKTFNPDNCKQHDSFGTPRSALTEDTLNDQTQWSCSSRCYPIFSHLSCSSLGSILTWPTGCDQWDWDWIATAAWRDIIPPISKQRAHQSANRRRYYSKVQPSSSSPLSSTALSKHQPVVSANNNLVEPGYPRATSTSSWIANQCLYGLLNSLHFPVEWTQYSTLHQTWDDTVEWRYYSTLLLLHQISRARHATDMWYHDVVNEVRWTWVEQVKSTSNSDIHVHMQLQMIQFNSWHCRLTEYHSSSTVYCCVLYTHHPSSRSTNSTKHFSYHCIPLVIFDTVH
jgi:hypothetical protein